MTTPKSDTVYNFFGMKSVWRCIFTQVLWQKRMCWIGRWPQTQVFIQTLRGVGYVGVKVVNDMYGGSRDVMIGYKFPTTARSQYVGIYYNILYKFLCVFKHFFTHSFYYYNFFFFLRISGLGYIMITWPSHVICVCVCACDSFSGTLGNDFT